MGFACRHPLIDYTPLKSVDTAVAVRKTPDGGVRRRYDISHAPTVPKQRPRSRACSAQAWDFGGRNHSHFTASMSASSTLETPTSSQDDLAGPGTSPVLRRN